MNVGRLILGIGLWLGGAALGAMSWALAYNGVTGADVLWKLVVMSALGALAGGFVAACSLSQSGTSRKRYFPRRVNSDKELKFKKAVCNLFVPPNRKGNHTN